MVIKKKPKVVINAGATVIVDGKHFHCSSTNEKTGNTPTEVIKKLKECIDKVASGKAPRRKK